MLADVGEFTHFVEGRILAPPIILIIAGAIVFIIAFLGCYGAIKEHYNMLIAVSLIMNNVSHKIKEFKAVQFYLH